MRKMPIAKFVAIKNLFTINKKGSLYLASEPAAKEKTRGSRDLSITRRRHLVNVTALDQLRRGARAAVNAAPYTLCHL